MKPQKGQPSEDEEIPREEGSAREAQGPARPAVERRRSRWSALLLPGAAASLGTGVVVWGTGASGPDIATVASSPLFFLGVTGAFAASLRAAWLVENAPARDPKRRLGIVLGVALLLRLIALPASPGLSDDAYRYLWDGHVQSRGINPYVHAPEDPALDAVATGFRPLINNADLPTIYPPLSQMIFLAAALAGGGLLSLKILLLLFDGMTILALASILKRRGQDPARVVIYAWSPLAVIEVGWSAHLDPIGVSLLVVGILAAACSRPLAAVVAGALSGAAKYAGWLALPSLGRRAPGRAILTIPAVVVLCYVPYLSAGAGVLGSLLVYAEYWRFNDSLFGIIVAAVEATGLAGAGGSGLPGGGTSLAAFLADPFRLAKIIAALLFGLAALRILRRGWEDPAREILWVLGAALLLSPTLHPWYLLWVAPLLALVPRLSWTWLTWAVIVFGYPMMAAQMGGEYPPAWLAWLEYAPFYILLAVESARRRLWEKDAAGWQPI